MNNKNEKSKTMKKVENNETRKTQNSIKEKTKLTQNNEVNQTSEIDKSIEIELKNYEKTVLEFLKEEKTDIINIEDTKEIDIKDIKKR